MGALQRCPSCDQSVSKQANACPGCGHAFRALVHTALAGVVGVDSVQIGDDPHGTVDDGCLMPYRLEFFSGQVVGVVDNLSDATLLAAARAITKPDYQGTPSVIRRFGYVGIRIPAHGAYKYDEHIRVVDAPKWGGRRD